MSTNEHTLAQRQEALILALLGEGEIAGFDAERVRIAGAALQRKRAANRRGHDCQRRRFWQRWRD